MRQNISTWFSTIIPNPILLSKNYRSIIIISILGLAWILGSRASLRLAAMTLFVVGGPILLIILLQRLELGILAVVPTSFFIRWEIGTGTNVSLNFTILLLAGLIGVWLLRQIAIVRDFRLVQSAVNVPAIAFLVAVTISLIAGNIDWILTARERASLPAQFGAWLLYTIPIGWILWSINNVNEVRLIRLTALTFLVFGSISIVGYAIPSLSKILSLFAPRSTEAMFWTWIVSIAFGQSLLNRGLSTQVRLLLALLVIFTFSAAWFHGRKEWVSGWLPGLVSVWVILWLYSWKAGAALTVVGGFLLMLNYMSLRANIVTDTQQYSALSRYATLPIMYELIKASPLLGLGPANYYHYTVLYPLLGWYVKFNSHNNYIDIIAQTGLVGFAIFGWLMASIGFIGIRLYKRISEIAQKDRDDYFSLGLVGAALGGVAGMLVSGILGDWFLPFLYNIGFSGFRSSVYAWLFIGSLLALDVIYSHRID
ncbi:MAG: O-antigen ligase family protein [Anaerolineales bacterium]